MHLPIPRWARCSINVQLWSSMQWFFRMNSWQISRAVMSLGTSTARLLLSSLYTLITFHTGTHSLASEKVFRPSHFAVTGKSFEISYKAMTTDPDKESEMTEQTYNAEVYACCARAENRVINGAHLIPQATSHLTPSTLNTPHSCRMTVKQWEPGQQTGSRSWMFPFTCFTVPSLALSKRNSRTSNAYYRQIRAPSVQIKFRTAISDSSI